MARKPAFTSVDQFKITLKGIRPPIWRRIVVPETDTFHDLHLHIQAVMGWENAHLHAFYMKTPNGEKVEIDDPDQDGEGRNENKEKIADYFTLQNHTGIYLYDFGDSWEHAVKLEKILPREKGVKYPLCTGGKRACPPEDCGGIDGYIDLLEILKNPEDPEYEETLEWLGGDFDPESFSLP